MIDVELFVLAFLLLWTQSVGRNLRPIPTGLARSGFWKAKAVESSSQFGTGAAREFVETRRHPRFRLEVDVRVYPRDSAVVRGHTVDISESGLSAILRIEVPIGEVVRLEFTLPSGDVDVHALVRQRSAFRYGFQFVEATSAQGVIGRTCRLLEVEQADPGRGQS